MRKSDRHSSYPMAWPWQCCRHRVAAIGRLTVVVFLLGVAFGAGACSNGSALRNRCTGDASDGCVCGPGQCAAPDATVDATGTEADTATGIDSSDALSCWEIESAAATAFRKTFDGYRDCQVDSDCTIMDLGNTCLLQCTVVLSVAAVEDVKATAAHLCQQFVAQGCVPSSILGCLKEFPPKCLAGACTPQYASDRDASADEELL